MKHNVDVAAMLRESSANQAETDILVAFALLKADPHKRVGAIADYFGTNSNTLDRDDFMLAFHLAECFPALAPEAIDKAVRVLVSLSKKIWKLEMIKGNDRMLRKHELGTLRALEKNASDLCRKIGCEAEFVDYRSGCGIAVKLPNRRSNNMGGEAWNVLGK